MLAVVALFVAIASLSAQKNIQETVTDEKFSNRTIVYKKGNADDAEILAQLNDSYGMSDVVRIAVAPPKPVVKPVAVIEKVSVTSAASTSKPAATVISTTRTTSATVSASRSAVVTRPNQPVLPTTIPKTTATDLNVPVANPDAAGLTAGTDVMAAFVTSNNQTVKNVSAQSVQQLNPVVQTSSENSFVGTTSTFKQTSSAVKSGKKSKSGGWFDSSSARKKSTPAKKHGKHGKQRYDCFKF